MARETDRAVATREVGVVAVSEVRGCATPPTREGAPTAVSGADARGVGITVRPVKDDLAAGILLVAVGVFIPGDKPVL